MGWPCGFSSFVTAEHLVIDRTSGTTACVDDVPEQRAMELQCGGSSGYGSVWRSAGILGIAAVGRGGLESENDRQWRHDIGWVCCGLSHGLSIPVVVRRKIGDGS